jgi:hypothetical protein
MTKLRLEELKAAHAARAAARAARDAARAAWDAYYDELKKIQEENSND